MAEKGKQQVAIASALGGAVIVSLLVGWYLSGGDGDLIEQASGGDQDGRLAATSELGSRGSAASADALARQVRDGDTQVAVRSLVALRRHERVKDHASEIVQAARDERPEVREAAAVAMTSLEEQADRPVLRRMVSSEREEPTVRAAAASSLGKLQDWDSIPTLIDAMGDRDPLVRGRAYASLVRIIGLDYGFRAKAPLAERNRVIAKLKQVNWSAHKTAHQEYLERTRKRE